MVQATTFHTTAVQTTLVHTTIDHTVQTTPVRIDSLFVLDFASCIQISSTQSHIELNLEWFLKVTNDNILYEYMVV